MEENDSKMPMRHSGSNCSINLAQLEQATKKSANENLPKFSLKRLSYSLSSSSNEATPCQTPQVDFSAFRICKLRLMQTLQGNEMNAMTRHEIATFIKQIPTTEGQQALVDFLIGTAIPAAVENNACKALNCATNNLEHAWSDRNLDVLDNLWTRTLTEIIPNMESMLYPLKKNIPSFDVYYQILASFRERVLNRVLSSCDESIPQLQPMIISVAFATADGTEADDEFSKIADTILGSEAAEELIQLTNTAPF